MFKKFLRICSTILTLVMLVNMLPLNAWAVGSISESSLELSANDTVTSGEQTDIDLSNARIVEEVVAHRTEYSKEFKLNNGLYVSAVYPQAVHYETDNGWEEIDNTLKTNSDGTYSNTSGTWDVRFPQQLSGSKDIIITKDGYTLSFRMAGELRQQPNVSVYAVDSASLTAETFQITENGTVQTFAVQSAQTAQGQVQAIDLTQAKAEAQYEEFVIGKNTSKLLYADVYANTDIRYDLKANQVKESIILESYSSTLRGYRYSLNTGGMIPVLQEDNSIWFYDAQQENVVMTMPAPFLVDANNEYNYDVQVSLTGSGNNWTLSYTLPNAWLADTARAWPVVLDPQVSTQPDVLNIRDQTIASNGSYSMYRNVLECGYGPSNHIHRVYLKYRDLPALTSSDVVIKAEISLLKNNNTANTPIYIEAHKVLENWESESITWADHDNYNTTVEDVKYIQNDGSTYTWEITDIVREWYAGKNYGVMFKASDATEAAGGNSWKHFYSSDCGTTSYMPSLTIYFRNNNGLEDYWDYTATSAGRAGTGYVNNYTGNLVWVRPDMGFDSNRMPVSISHIYNANDSAHNDFGLGMGWRTNYNQLLYQMEGDSNRYIWEDADGTKHYFLYNASTGKYKNEEGLNLTLTVNTTSSGGTTYQITDPSENVSQFDSSGRLVRQTNKQSTTSSIIITYDGDTKRISTITDGIGRVYRFTYSTSTNLLSRLSCTNTNSSGISTELTYLTCTYSGNQLTRITDKDGKYVTYGYGSNALLQSAVNLDGSKLQYTYNTRSATFQPYRVIKIKAFDGSIEGGELNIEYANNQTVFRDYNGNVQIMQFNNFGNTISIQDGHGNAQTAMYANNDANDENNTAKANQLTLASQLQNTVGNMFKNSSFENGTTWTATASTVSQSTPSGAAYFGSKCLSVTTTASGVGVKSGSFTALPGKSYTFSAYVRTWTTAAYLALSDGSSTVTSDTLAINRNWTRLQVTYTNTKSYSVTITAQCIASGAGIFYVDCVQLENAPYASRCNLIENGDFRYGLDGWTNNGGYTSATLTSAAEQLDNTVCKVTGNNQLEKRLVQTLDMLGWEGDIYTLTGWAKGDCIPLSGYREFAIFVTINYLYEDPEQFVAQFNPDSDSANSWQYTAVEFVAAADYKSITIEIAYDYNLNTVYFDGIQLYKEALGATYEYDDRGNVKTYRDLLGQTTTYTYNSDDELIQEVRPGEETLTYEYDDYHNLKKITSSNGTVQEYAYTPYGNCKKITTTVDDITVTEEYLYSTEGKEVLQIKRTSLGEELVYLYDRNTGLLTQINDAEETTFTNYTYDSMYRLTGELVTSGESVQRVNYGYEDDLLSTINTASTSYNFSYGNFSQINRINIGTTRTLANYYYNDETVDDRKNDLDRIDYGNGDRVEYVYDDQGRVIQEIYTSKNGTTGDQGTVFYTYNSDGSLASIRDSYSSVYSYNYAYDSLGRLIQIKRGNWTIANYTYNNLGQLTRVDDKYYGRTDYEYDAVGRRLSSETNQSTQKSYTYSDSGILQGTTVKDNTSNNTILSQSFNYSNGSAADGMLKSYTVSTANYSSTLSYNYDEKGNITLIRNGSNIIVSYVYDDANQLVRENNRQAGKTWTWSYDSAGNILSKSEYAYTTGELGTPIDTVTYTYGDADWGDLLTGYDGKAVTSDEIGNPLNDGRRTYTWERGRRVASINGAAMYYDSDGMLAEQYIGNKYYSYTYREGRLTDLEILIDWNEYYLTIAYDANGTPISLKYDFWIYDEDLDDFLFYSGTYYYVLNPQGDVIGLVDANGYLVAEYVYDAWGMLRDMDCPQGEGSVAYTIAYYNPIRYRGYIYDVESGLYYLKSRFYDPEMGRFINADNQLATGDITGMNLFAYCGNNPVNRIDPTGEAWGHWILGAVIVVACAAATVITCGGFAAAVTAVGMVGCGVAAATTASTVAAAAFIGSATVYGTAVLMAASDSSSLQDFADHGNWGTVIATVFGGGIGAYDGYNMYQTQSTQYNNAYNYSGGKNEKYTQKRGWSDQRIRNAIHNGRQGTTTNRAGEACTAYGYPGLDNQYVVINNSTRSVVQASNLYDSNWVVDSRIIWAP